MTGLSLSSCKFPEAISTRHSREKCNRLANRSLKIYRIPDGKRLPDVNRPTQKPKVQ